MRRRALLMGGKKSLLRGLTSYLKFNDNLTDAIADEVTWNPTGTAPSYVYGFFNKAVKFSATGAIRAQGTGTSVFSISNSAQDLPFTFSIRIKWLTDSSQDTAIIAKGIYTSSGPIEYGLRIDAASKQPYFIRYSNSSISDYKKTIADFALAKNVWYHIVVCGNGTDVFMYINGVDVTGATTTTGTYTKMTPSVEHLGIANRGYITPGANWQFLGDIDEFLFWNRQLTAEDVNALFNRTSELM